MLLAIVEGRTEGFGRRLEAHLRSTGGKASREVIIQAGFLRVRWSVCSEERRFQQEGANAKMCN